MSTPIPTAVPALVRVASLGLVLAGCPDCRLPLGVAGAPGLAAALAAHQRGCPKRPPAPPPAPEDSVCPGCGCEAALVLCASGWRCGDCLAELLQADPAPVIAHTPRRHRQQRRRRRAAEPAAVA